MTCDGGEDHDLVVLLREQLPDECDRPIKPACGYRVGQVEHDGIQYRRAYRIDVIALDNAGRGVCGCLFHLTGEVGHGIAAQEDHVRRISRFDHAAECLCTTLEPRHQLLLLCVCELGKAGVLLERFVQLGALVRLAVQHVVVEHEADVLRQITKYARQHVCEAGRRLEQVEVLDDDELFICHRGIAVNGLGQHFRCQTLALKLNKIEIRKGLVHHLLPQLPQIVFLHVAFLARNDVQRGKFAVFQVADQL